MKVEVFIPKEHVDEMVTQLNDAGLLSEGNYDYSYSYTPVQGHFRPLEGAKPERGEIGEITQVDEMKVEFRVNMADRQTTERLINQVHPYEVPVINFIELL